MAGCWKLDDLEDNTEGFAAEWDEMKYVLTGMRESVVHGYKADTESS